MHLILALTLQLQAGVPADSVEAIREAARRAEARFERLARSMAPTDWGSGGGGHCDEIVGRFCLIFDEGRLPDPKPEAARVTDARREAIEALRLAFSHEPGRLETTGPLVRYLVEDERASEAVSAARTYAVLTRDSVWGPLLLGFALHAAADDSAAERHLDEGLARLPEAERRQILDVGWIVSPDDEDVYDATSGSARDSLERVLWRHSDPLYLTPGNERRAEHVARHVWSRILAMTPRVREMLRWGDDLDELTVRYGVPAARTRTWGTIYREGSLVEHYDPDQLAYVQADLFAKGPAPVPPPGADWPLAEVRSRSGYAARTVRRLVALEHQVTRFPAPAGGSVLRVDARLVLDSMASAEARRVVTALHVLDAASLTPLAAVEDTVAVHGDTVRLALEADAGQSSVIYSMEALEPATRLGGRARYAVDLDTAEAGFDLSDPLMAEAWPADGIPVGRADPNLRPHARLVFREGDEIGLYAEAVGLRAVAGERRYRVELSIRRADRASFPARALSWLGRTLGLSSERPPPRVAWEGSAPGGAEPAVLAVNVPLADVSEGLYALVLAVTDAATGETRETTRIVRIEE